MHMTTAAFALMPLLAAANAPLVHDNPFGVTFSATIGQRDATSISGAVKIAAAPDGEGVNVQISLFNLPTNGKISYGLHTDSVADNGDCSTTGGLLNPYNGVTGSQCNRHASACQVGDLSDRHGPAAVAGGGSGTGYFAASFIDKYLSLRPDNPAYVGGKSLVVRSSSGAYLACANFVNAMEAASTSTHVLEQASSIAIAAASNSATAASKTKKPYPYPHHSGTASSTASSASSGPEARVKIPIGIIGIVAMIAGLI